MNTITINVSPEIANFFQTVDTKAKNRVELYVNAWLNNAWLNETCGKKTANESLLDVMKKSSVEAKSNGYKPEMIEAITEDILKDDNG